MTDSAPFRRGPFDTLPALPRVPHAYGTTLGQDVVLSTPSLGEVRLHVRTTGEGPPLLLVHGLMTSGYSFRHVVEPLAKTHRLFVPDLPGAGRSGFASRPLSAAALAELLVALVGALGIRGCRAVGNSMGGYLCLRAALDDPGAFSALVDVHSPGVPEARLWALSAVLSTAAGRALLTAMVARDPHRWVHRNVHYRDESLKSQEEAREYGAPLETTFGRAAFVSYLRDALDPRGMAELVARLARRRDAGQPFPVPLALVYSTEDPMVPPRVGRELAALIPSAELHWMDQSSHFAHVDSPERFMALASDFFCRTAPCREIDRASAQSLGGTETQGLSRS